MTKSPLRYPGAKKKVLDRFLPFWKKEHIEYRDVFVGGGSTFFGKPLSLQNWINDFDTEVAELYIVMRDQPEELCELIMNTIPTVELWREIKQAEYHTSLEKGFRTFFLNRTNFSGILKGNPIGGIHQKSVYKIDCRWNPKALCEQVRNCHLMLQNVRITALDFEEIIQVPGESVLMYLDPPYFHKGSLLYRVGMNQQDHERLASNLQETDHHFFITYDDCLEVRELYEEWAYLYPASWFYSSSNKKTREVGKELFISNYPIEEQLAMSLLKT
ncbi:hypothetical protein C0Q44_00555 [Paenibacillus sp. PCH8]|uniref:DNA adenine methylase n=1 Tax=Paenibacillus sp. PCH8 TaxID=2066524 RepID=UPI000CF92142|nr:DNA adenine methylase [Paenibacillus sp. PCH8]PQP83258.1 hypothetical protein C0Q44_00555 [Paenibacillus sp. PCH8]